MDYIKDRLGERSTWIVILALSALAANIGLTQETLMSYLSQAGNLIGLLALAGVLVIPDDMNPLEYLVSEFGPWTTRIGLLVVTVLLVYVGVTEEKVAEFITEFENIVYFAAFAGMTAFPSSVKQLN